MTQLIISRNPRLVTIITRGVQGPQGPAGDGGVVQEVSAPLQLQEVAGENVLSINFDDLVLDGGTLD